MFTFYLVYQWLVEVLGILQRDISLSNIMYHRTPRGIFGVLNDFDLAVGRNVSGPTSRQRTGTTPYMAMDLLLPVTPRHLCRHDLESLHYVIVALTTGYHEGQKVPNPPLQAWFQTTGTTLHGLKNSYFFTPAPLATEHFAAFDDWIIPMQTMFADGINARKNHINTQNRRARKGDTEPLIQSFDDETLGGHVTLAAMGKIFDISLN